jgi:2'-5' RNA ligase
MADAGDREREAEHGEREERVRAFIALDPPDATADTIAAWQRQALGGRDDLRAIDRDALHLTLAFLGDCDRAGIERARQALLAAAASPRPVPVRLAAAPIGLPRRRPRVVAFAAESPGAVSLHEGLAGELAAAGLLAADERRFRPHLSVARVRGDRRGQAGPRGRRAREVLAGLPALAERSGHTFDAVRVALYRSQLRSQGARYSVLADVDLPRSGS